MTPGTRLGSMLIMGRTLGLAGIVVSLLTWFLIGLLSPGEKIGPEVYLEKLEAGFRSKVEPEEISLPPAEPLPRPSEHPEAPREKLPSKKPDDFSTLSFNPVGSMNAGSFLFPPAGTPAGEFSISVYHALQKNYSKTTLKVNSGPGFISLYGAARCEEIEDGQLLLVPCVFLERIPRAGSGESSFENSLAKTLMYALELEFTPWARFSTSFLGCARPGEFRMSVQFGEGPTDTMISIRLPYSADQDDALTDLEVAQKEPCNGIDVFLPLQGAIELLSLLGREAE